MWIAAGLRNCRAVGDVTLQTCASRLTWGDELVRPRELCHVAHRLEAGASVSFAFPDLCGWLFLRRTAPFARRNWGRSTLSTLTLLGLAVAVIGMLAFGVFADRHLGPYVPAHIENGVVVPGRIQ